MPEQLSLAGFEAPRVATDRLFFALFPDADTAARIEHLAQRLRSEHGLKGKPLATARFHVTLHHLGDYAGVPLDIVAAARKAAAAVAMAPFEVAFDRVASFSRKPHNRPVILLGDGGVAALTVFQRALGAALKKAGLWCGAAAHYTPHLTLLYDDRHVAEQAIEPVAWTAHEFVLVHSLLGQTKHVPLARWPLCG